MMRKKRFSPLQALGGTALLALAAAACVLYSKLVPGTADENPLSPASDDVPLSGGTSDYSDPDAPKSIGCANISSFRLNVFLQSVAIPEGSILTARSYSLSAAEGNGAVSCVRMSAACPEETFTAEAGFLSELQSIVTRYDLAQFNGHHRETHGLPEDFGAHLKVSYTSGESISASDNQNMFLPLGAVEDLVRLFYGSPEQTAAESSFRSISMEEAANLMFEEGVRIIDVRRPEEFSAGHIPGAVCIPNEEIQAENFQGLDDKDQTLLIYCRSGRRSKEAARKLAELGYTSVLEFGGILDWPGEVITEQD